MTYAFRFGDWTPRTSSFENMTRGKLPHLWRTSLLLFSKKKAHISKVCKMKIIFLAGEKGREREKELGYLKSLHE